MKNVNNEKGVKKKVLDKPKEGLMRTKNRGYSWLISINNTSSKLSGGKSK